MLATRLAKIMASVIGRGLGLDRLDRHRGHCGRQSPTSWCRAIAWAASGMSSSAFLVA